MKSKALMAAAILLALGATSGACRADTFASCETAGNFAIGGSANVAACTPLDQSDIVPGGDHWFRSESAAARADYGILGVKGSGRFSGYIKPSEAGPNTGWNTEAYFKDLLTITGTPFDGSIAFTLQMTGSEDITGTGDFFSYPDVTTYLSAVAGGSPSSYVFTITGPEEVTAIFPFYASYFSAEDTLTMSLQFDLVSYGGCGISGEGSCLAQANFYDTARVAGYILSGNPDASISFASGTDYNNIPGDIPSPTPEPASAAMMLAGFLGLGAMIRRHKCAARGP
jgi:hypothetical protein